MKAKDQSKQTSLEWDGFKGPVKMVRQTNHRVKIQSGKIVPGKMTECLHDDDNLLYIYNEKGVRLQYHQIGVDGSSHKYICNDKGKIIRAASCDPDGNVLSESNSIYDSNDNSIEVIQIDFKTGKVNKTIREFDNNGNMVVSISSNEDKSQVYRHVSKYNDDGNQISSHQYSNDKLTGYLTYKYDEKGNNIEMQVYLPDGNLDYRQVYLYNEKGWLMEQKTYNGDGSLGNEYLQHIYERDSDGNLVFKDKTPKGYRYEYEYDKHENWIKKIEFYKKFPVIMALREIQYFDDEPENKDEKTNFETTDAELQTSDMKPKTQTSDKSEVNNLGSIEELAKKQLTSTDKTQAMWLVENCTADNFPAMRYYALMNNEMPSVTNFLGQQIAAMTLLTELKENMDARVIHNYNTQYDFHVLQPTRFTLAFPNSAYLLQATQIHLSEEDEFEIPDFMECDAARIFTSQFTLFHPSQDSEKHNPKFEKDLDYYIEMCTLKKTPDKPTIFMIESRGDKFEMESHDIDDKFEIKDLNLNYGHGFDKFHNELMQRFNTETKGLVLFHGEPGTGKTYYIRHLLRSMASNNKLVIYMPPNMVDHMVEPAFMTFISDEIKQWSEDGYFCVLLIEDAEPLLAKRQEGVRIQGITNLLNMTDGILNDMLNLQIICTFNVDLKKLDSALLRPGRLIARKEFKKLAELDANLLAQRLGIKHHFTKPATLGEIYSMQKNKNTLIHDVEQDKDASTLIDDI